LLVFVDSVLFEDVLLCNDELDELRLTRFGFSVDDFRCWRSEREGTEEVCDELESCGGGGGGGGGGDGIMLQQAMASIIYTAISEEPASVV
jgi:hypothetical protein